MKGILKKLEIVCYWAVILYMLDTLLLGTGAITKQFGFSTRMIFFVAALVSCVPGMIAQWKELVKNKYFWTVFLFMAVIGINMIRGIAAGNSSMILLSDVRGFLNYLIIIPMVYVLRSKESVTKFLKIFVHLTAVMAVFAIVLSFFIKFPENTQEELYSFLNGYGICGISTLTRRIVRVFFHTAGRWFFVAGMFAFGFSVLESKKKFLWLVEMSLMMAATFISFTRSIYLGVAVGIIVLVVLVCVCYKEYFKDMLKNCIIMAVITVLVITGMSVVAEGNMFKVALQRTLLIAGDDISDDDGADSWDEDELLNDDAEEENLNIRGSREEIVRENIKKNPIFGGGLGVVNDANGEHIEYFYLDIWSKIGIVGVIIFLLPYVMQIWDIAKKKNVYSKEQRILSLMGNSGLTCLLVISYFNPCMNTTVGLAIYGLAITLVMPWEQKNNQQLI